MMLVVNRPAIHWLISMLTLAFSSKSCCAQVQCALDQPWTVTVWLQRSEQWLLTEIRPTALRFQSTCVFPVSVSTSFPTRCSAKRPGVRGGLRTLCLLSCIQQCAVYVSNLNHLCHRFLRGPIGLFMLIIWVCVESCSISKLIITVLEVGCASVFLEDLPEHFLFWLNCAFLGWQPNFNSSETDQLRSFMPWSNLPESVLKTTRSSGRVNWKWKRSSLRKKVSLAYTHAFSHTGRIRRWRTWHLWISLQHTDD